VNGDLSKTNGSYPDTPPVVIILVHTLAAVPAIIPSTPMMQRAHPPLRVFPAPRWAGTFPIPRYTFRGRPALMPPTRLISTSPVNLGRARSRAFSPYQRLLVITREAGGKRGLSVGQIVGYPFLLIIGDNIFDSSPSTATYFSRLHIL